MAGHLILGPRVMGLNFEELKQGWWTINWTVNLKNRDSRELNLRIWSKESRILDIGTWDSRD